jgi:hypothetical protein
VCRKGCSTRKSCPHSHTMERVSRGTNKARVARMVPPRQFFRFLFLLFPCWEIMQLPRTLPSGACTWLLTNVIVTAEVITGACCACPTAADTPERLISGWKLEAACAAGAPHECRMSCYLVGHVGGLGRSQLRQWLPPTQQPPGFCISTFY